MNAPLSPDSLSTGSAVEALPAGSPRPGAVDLERVTLIRQAELEESSAFREMTERLRESEAILDALERQGRIPRDALLTQTLDELVAEGGLDGLVVGSEDGFVIGRSSSLGEAELLAVVATVFDFVLRRIQSEHLIESVDELTARGAKGEQIILRFFPGPTGRFYLVAYSRAATTYRRTMARALRRCAAILADPGPSPTPARRPRPMRAAEPPVAPAAPTAAAALSDLSGSGIPKAPVTPLCPAASAEPANLTQNNPKPETSPLWPK